MSAQAEQSNRLASGRSWCTAQVSQAFVEACRRYGQISHVSVPEWFFWLLVDEAGEDVTVAPVAGWSDEEDMSLVVEIGGVSVRSRVPEGDDDTEILAHAGDATPGQQSGVRCSAPPRWRGPQRRGG